MKLEHRLSALPNYIFILGLIAGFNVLGKDNCKTRQETFKIWDSVRPINERFDGNLYKKQIKVPIKRRNHISKLNITP